MSDKCKHGIRDTETNLPYCRRCDDEMKSSFAAPPGSATCCLCNWTNVRLLNLGEPSKPRWTCHGCCKRMLDALTEIAETGYNNCSHQTMQALAQGALSPNGRMSDADKKI